MIAGNIRKPGRRRRTWIILLIAGIVLYLSYYQLWHRSPEVNSGIYVLQHLLKGHDADIWTVKFTPGGEQVVSAGVDSTIKVWNVNTGRLAASIKHPAGLTTADVSADGNYVASSSYDSKLRLWKLPEGILQKTFSGHLGTAWCVRFSPDGKTIASCGEDSVIRLWDVQTGEQLRTFRGHTRNIWDIQFSPDGKTLASGSFDKTLRIWNVQDGRLLHILGAHTEAVVALAFSHDGTKLVSTSDDKTIRLWNTANWSLVYSLDVPEHNQAASFSPDDHWLVTGGRDKTMPGEFLQNIFGDSEFNKGVSMRLWEVGTGRLLQTFAEHANDVNDVVFSPDGKMIAAASSDRTISVWKRGR